MEKQVLSIAQMQKLKEMGVDTSKASMVWIYDNMHGFYRLYINEDHEHDSEKVPTFTLQDIFEIIPKVIDGYFLSIYASIPMIRYDKYTFGKCEGLKGFDFYGDTDMLFIDFAVNILCALAEKGYLKTN